MSSRITIPATTQSSAPGAAEACISSPTKWRRLEQSRRLFGFDSFAGLPELGESDGHKLYWGMFADNDDNETMAFFAAKGFKSVEFIRDWFHGTIGRIDDKQLALCHIDADTYDSVKLALERSYECVAPGGYIIFDDYGHPDCSGATTTAKEFFARRREVLHRAPGIDCSAWVRKEA